MSGSLLVENLRVNAGAAALVRGVSLQARLGQPFTMLGETGSGKTLVLQAVMGTLPPGLSASGTVVIDTVRSDAEDRTARRAFWGRKVALLPQEPWLALDPLMRAGEQVAEVHRFLHRRDRPAAAAAAATDLRAVGLDGAGRHFPFQLSGGMAQRLAFAASAASGAPILLADEPTKGLDAKLRDATGTLLHSFCAAGGVLLTITHDIALARRLGGQVVVMRDGAVVEEGDAATVLSEPTHPYTRSLLRAEPSAWPARPAIPAGPALLRGESLRLQLGGAVLFDGLDVVVGEGEWLAVTGSSGSGKTSLGNVLLGLRRPDAGRVVRRRDIPRLRLQKIYQDPVASFAPDRSLRRSLNDVSRRHGLPVTAADALLARLGIAPALLDRLPTEVSGGELQRVALARVLMLRPALVFADEPTSRLDPVSQQNTIELMREVCGEMGCAVLLVTHDPALAAAVARRSLAVSAG